MRAKELSKACYEAEEKAKFEMEILRPAFHSLADDSSEKVMIGQRIKRMSAIREALTKAIYHFDKLVPFEEALTEDEKKSE